MRTTKAQISTFVVRFLDSIIPLVSIYEISSLQLASVAEQTDLSLPWTQTPKTGFLMTRLRWWTDYHNVPKYSDPQKIAVIILKFEQYGFTLFTTEYCVHKIQVAWQTV